MRIVVVSAHYPPNFVSGGTLQAQRMARGLQARGHHVSVYAGWFGKARPVGERWDEADEAGLAVRWTVTTPWTLWNDDRNWDNPEVAADFSAYLDEAGPDVVHLHSLQSLGAGLVQVAARAGARVVVTMHDFWWFCARQFLVDRQVQPCCLVVDAGVCPCECDRSWLLNRNAKLRALLDCADVVLAPSSSAARVLAANGVDPRRLAVDENGLPAPLDPSTEPAPRGPSDVVRALYVGGPNPLKGVHVVLEAARRLADRPGWRLVAHDVEPYLRSSGTSIEGLPVDPAPPFVPAEADHVYAGADVVVIPSVMRETFSLVAREALTRGVPVICTDTLGPEEVVRHEGNGLIVPAADAAALAAALRRLLDEPELLPRLRLECGLVSVRNVRDQLDGLEAMFVRLLSTPRPEPDRQSGHERESHHRQPIGRVLFVCGIDGAPLRYRARLPAEALGLLGVTSDVVHYRDPEVDQLAERADAVVLYRVPATVQVLALIDAVRARGVPTFFDVDDLVFDPDIADEIPALELLPPAEASLWLEGVRRYRTTMEACDVYIGSTEPLCRHAAAVTGMPAQRFDNGVGLLVARLSDRARARPRRPGPLRMGYLSGTKTHDLDWRSVEPAVAEILTRHREAELWLVGHVNVSPVLAAFGSRIRRHSFRPWPELPAILRDLDVNLVPLVPGGRFNEAKSPIKWLEAALTETPTIAVPTEPLADVVDAGHNGLLASDPDEWVAALDLLLGDAELRQRLGRRARRDALLSLSPHLQGRRYLEILERGIGAGSGAPDSASRPRRAAVALDEPPLRLALEPYQVGPEPVPDGTDGVGARVGPRARHLAATAWSSWRSEGGAATVKRAAAYSRRQYEGRVRPALDAQSHRLRRSSRPQPGSGAGPLPETVLVRVPPVAGRPASGFRMHTRSGSDQIARDLYRMGWHGFERPVPDVFARLAAADDGVVLDVGANTGFYSLVAASASPSVGVHAFEPFPAARECLEENLALNPGLRPRVTVFPSAVSDAVGESTLFVPDPGHGLVETSCSLNGEFKERVVDRLTVPVVTVDAHLAALGRPRVSVVKIDVESLEHRVLAGAERTLGEDRPFVLIEVLPSGDPAAIDRLRRRHDYVAVRLRAESAVVGSPVEYDPRGWNQALVPSEKVGLLHEILAHVPLPAEDAGRAG